MAKKRNITKIKKRDGRVVDFDSEKITTAIYKAAEATGEFGKGEAKRLTGIVISILEKANGDGPRKAGSKARAIPTVEQVQDIVEQVLMAASHYETAKAYILYRRKQEELRSFKQVIGVEDDLEMSANAVKAMARRYLTRDDKGNVVETPQQAVERVSKTVASSERRKKKKWQDRFSEIISSFKFVPAGCYFRGAGRKRGLLANCFVLPVEDDMGQIFDAVRWTALIHQAGGGTGYNFSKLRPKGDVVGGGGFSSGPVSFMKAFDAATEIVMLGGRHRGANMGILNTDHPDIFEFITCKTQEGEIANFNISLGASDGFMKAVEADKGWKLVNPRTGEVVQTVGARKIFDQAVALAWKTGDPGMIYLDSVNGNNPLLDSLGPIEATNVCGEQPLHSFDVCNLGSINLAKFVTDVVPKQSGSSRASGKPENRVDWKDLEATARLAVRFLDDGIDASEYPIPQIEKMAKRVRRIGLGVMGWADMLLSLRVGYDSKQAVDLGTKLMKFIQKVGWEESQKLAREKGEFPLFKDSSYSKRHPVLGGKKKVRNVAVTTIAPTGTISMIADCSSGIEPIFALAYVKNVVDQQGMTYVNDIFEKELRDQITDGDSGEVDRILRQVTRAGSVADIEEVDDSIKSVFRTAHDIGPEWHVKMQAAFQKFTDNAVSKTINFPESATIDEIEKAYIDAWKAGCKGITIYRDKSKNMQILEVEKKDSAGLREKIQSKLSVVPLSLRVGEYSRGEEGRCPECGGEMYFAEGCSTCHECGYSKCDI